MQALWSEDQASVTGSTVCFHDVFLRPQPPRESIPVHIGGHTDAAAERAGRAGDGYFPFGVDHPGLARLAGAMRRAAEGAGRDPAAIELTASSYQVEPHEAREAIRARGALGVSRVAGRPPSSGVTLTPSCGTGPT